MKAMLFGAGLILCSAGTHAFQITPDEVLRQIDQRGAKAVVNELYDNDRYDLLMQRIGTGQQAWLDVILKLEAGTDGWTGEALWYALADALKTNPSSVYRFLGDKQSRYPLDFVCGVPYIEISDRDERLYLQRALPAVRQSRDDTGRGVKRQCLAKLEEAMADLKKRMREPFAKQKGHATSAGNAGSDAASKSGGQSGKQLESQLDGKLKRKSESQSESKFDVKPNVQSDNQAGTY